MSKRRKISRSKGKQAMLTEEMVYEMNRSVIYRLRDKVLYNLLNTLICPKIPNVVFLAAIVNRRLKFLIKGASNLWLTLLAIRQTSKKCYFCVVIRDRWLKLSLKLIQHMGEHLLFELLCLSVCHSNNGRYRSSACL